MINSLLPILLIMAVAWVWLDGARAREFATTLARRYCENRNLQFLDETVALARMGLRWTSGGPCVPGPRSRFDFSLEGAGRRTGYVLMLGTVLETIDDGLPQADEDDNPPPADQVPDDDGKVVPFRRRDR